VSLGQKPASIIRTMSSEYPRARGVVHSSGPYPRGRDSHVVKITRQHASKSTARSVSLLQLLARINVEIKLTNGPDLAVLLRFLCVARDVSAEKR
jgi:hypothetical protein